MYSDNDKYIFRLLWVKLRHSQFKLQAYISQSDQYATIYLNSRFREIHISNEDLSLSWISKPLLLPICIDNRATFIIL